AVAGPRRRPVPTGPAHPRGPPDAPHRRHTPHRCAGPGPGGGPRRDQGLRSRGGACCDSGNECGEAMNEIPTTPTTPTTPIMSSASAEAGLSRQARDFSWAVDAFVRKTDGVTDAVVVSGDGLPIAMSDTRGPDAADRLSAIVSGLAS